MEEFEKNYKLDDEALNEVNGGARAAEARDDMSKAAFMGSNAAKAMAEGAMRAAYGASVMGDASKASAALEQSAKAVANDAEKGVIIVSGDDADRSVNVKSVRGFKALGMRFKSLFGK